MSVELVPPNEQQLAIVRLYLEQRQSMSEFERKLFLEIINLIGHPVFITGDHKFSSPGAV